MRSVYCSHKSCQQRNTVRTNFQILNCPIIIFLKMRAPGSKVMTPSWRCFSSLGSRIFFNRALDVSRIAYHHRSNFSLCFFCRTAVSTFVQASINASRIVLNKAHHGMAGSGDVGRLYLGQEAARDFDNALFNDYQLSIYQLMEVAGLCVAQVLHVYG